MLLCNGRLDSKIKTQNLDFYTIMLICLATHLLKPDKCFCSNIWWNVLFFSGILLCPGNMLQLVTVSGCLKVIAVIFVPFWLKTLCTCTSGHAWAWPDVHVQTKHKHKQRRSTFTACMLPNRLQRFVIFLSFPVTLCWQMWWKSDSYEQLVNKTFSSHHYTPLSEFSKTEEQSPKDTRTRQQRGER